MTHIKIYTQLYTQTLTKKTNTNTKSVTKTHIYTKKDKIFRTSFSNLSLKYFQLK